MQLDTDAVKEWEYLCDVSIAQETNARSEIFWISHYNCERIE